MARPKAPDKDGDFLERLFEEPAPGKSAKSRARKRTGMADSRARLLAVLEAAGEGPDEAIVLDDALLAAYLDGALGREEQTALEGLLARSADLRDQLAGAVEARAAVLGGRARMPKSFIEDFDAVPAPNAARPAQSPSAVRGSALSRWLGALAPGRRWAMAALPAIFAVVIVAVIGPGVYEPEKAAAPKPGVVAEVAVKAAKDKPVAKVTKKPATGIGDKEKPPPTGASADFAPRKPRVASPRADVKRRFEDNTQVLASALIPLDGNLRAALVRMGLRQNRRLAAGGLPDAQGGAKPKAEKTPVANSPPPKAPRTAAEARRKPMAMAESGRLKQRRRRAMQAPAGNLRKPPAPIRRSIELALAKQCSASAPTCCERRRVDPELLKRLLGGGPPLQAIRVLRLSSKTCLFTLPSSQKGK
ncbi:MAG: hypothetical protein ACTSUD_12280 [Alphaproteobacteria bacterium]